MLNTMSLMAGYYSGYPKNQAIHEGSMAAGDGAQTNLTHRQNPPLCWSYEPLFSPLVTQSGPLTVESGSRPFPNGSPRPPRSALHPYETSRLSYQAIILMCEYSTEWPTLVFRHGTGSRFREPKDLRKTTYMSRPTHIE